jgi:methylated-DNA-[protein]-cysteine S-methyltransferase
VGGVNSVATVATPCGPFTMVVAPDEVVLASGWTADPAALLGARMGEWTRRPELGPVTGAVEAYFGGDLAAIRGVPVAQRAGPFMEQVWETLRAVPPGSPVTYQELAARCGRPAAARAAGTACGRNSAALFVPCHRARRGDGGLGGFAWGLAIKRWLLEYESDGQLAGHGVVGVEPPIDDVLHR